MINFTNCEKLYKGFDGANGRKLSIIYNNEKYMLKFPTIAKHNENMHYSNGCVNEYIGSKIYKILGIDVQEVELGTTI